MTTMNEFGQEHETADEEKVRTFLEEPPIDFPPVVPPPKKRVGWPKGKPRGPRKAKAAPTKPKKGFDPRELLARAGVADLSKARTLTELMFNIDHATAVVLEDMAAAMQALPEDSRRAVMAALARIFPS